MFFSFHRTPFRTFGKRNEKFASIIKNILRTLKLVTYGEAYENLRVETVSAFRYIKHAVVSCVPEGDAINRVCSIARHCGVITPVSLAGIFNLTSLCWMYYVWNTIWSCLYMGTSIYKRYKMWLAWENYKINILKNWYSNRWIIWSFVNCPTRSNLAEILNIWRR